MKTETKPMVEGLPLGMDAYASRRAVVNNLPAILRYPLYIADSIIHYMGQPSMHGGSTLWQAVRRGSYLAHNKFNHTSNSIVKNLPQKLQ